MTRLRNKQGKDKFTTTHFIINLPVILDKEKLLKLSERQERLHAKELNKTDHLTEDNG